MPPRSKFAPPENQRETIAGSGSLQLRVQRLVRLLRHIRVASKHELKECIMASIDEVNRHPVIHSWSYKLSGAA
jgi:hypothetical protein